MPNKFNPDISPDWRAIKLEETHHYNDQFLKRYNVDKVYGIYLTDLRTRVYCCEITPSYELYFVKSVYDGGPDIEDEEAIDALEQDLLECDANTESFVYMHCREIDALVDDCKSPIQLDEDDWSREDARDAGRELDAAYDNFVSNPVW